MSYKIYALVSDKKVYIGKTRAKNFSALIRKHAKRKIKATRSLFRRNEPAPTVHILHTGETESYLVYRYILAFCRLFIDQGYDILNCATTINNAMNLKSDTQILFNQIKVHPLDIILDNSKLSKPSDTDEKPNSQNNSKQIDKVKKLTICLSRSEKENFDNLAKSHNLSQKQLLLYLLENQQPEDTARFSALLQKKQDKIDQLKAQNNQFRMALKEANETRKKDKHDFKTQFGLVRKGISDFYKLMVSTSILRLEIETGCFSDFTTRDSFHYPSESGYYLVRPIAVLYGKGRYPARFILAVGDNSTLLKFRWYPKPQFVGVPIMDPRFSFRSSAWLIGCDRANDGAMDIVAAFPLNIEFRYRGPDEYESEPKRFVADAIREIDS